MSSPAPANAALRPPHDRLRCPNCLAPLEPVDQVLRCRNCARDHHCHGGVWDFAPDSSYYYGEIPQPEMQAILRLMSESQLSWLDAYAQGTANLPQQQRLYAEEYATALNRTGWKVLCPLQGQAALDIGCGWGLITMSLAPHFDQVVALDLCLERAQMTVARCREQQLHNVIGVHAGGQGSLPFPDQAFDLIIVNGVLEYVATSRTGNPRQLQLQYLQELRRVLKPDGQLYLAIENRYYWRYLLGGKDHSGIGGIAPLPRWFAHALARAHGQPSYREYLYSRQGYRRLLRAAGFHATRFALPFPIYWEPRTILPEATSTAGWREAFQPRSRKGKLLQRLGGFGNIYRKFVSSFAINCGATAIQPSFLDRLCTRLNESPTLQAPDWQVTYFRMLTGGKIKAFCHSPTKDTRVVVTIATNPVSQENLRHQLTLLRALRRPERLPPVSRNLLPELLADWEDCRLRVAVEAHATGAPASNQRLASAEREQIRGQLIDFLITLASPKTSPTASPTYFADLLQFARQHARFGSDAIEHEIAEAVARLEGRRLPPVVVHGDLGFHNVFLDPATHQVTGILDWDVSLAAGPVGLDMVNMQLWEILQREPVSIAAGLRELAQSYRANDTAAREFSRYAQALGVSSDIREDLVRVYPLWSFHHLWLATTTGGIGQVRQWHTLRQQFATVFQPPVRS